MVWDKEFNGFAFNDKSMRKRMKYIVVQDGDLDINNAYAFPNKKELKQFLNGERNYAIAKTIAVFKIEDLTEEFLE